MTSPTAAHLEMDDKHDTLICHGAWSIAHLGGLTTQFTQSSIPCSRELTLDGSAITQFDSAGALAIAECISRLEEKNNPVNMKGFTKKQRILIALVADKKALLAYMPPAPIADPMLSSIGRETLHKLHEAKGFLKLLGELSLKIREALGDWQRFHVPSILSNVDSAGIKALPIVGLLSFLIGVVLAYQMGLQLKTYGANIFIAYLSGMAIFREFAPLITAIIIAGRTSSAFTAQIGSMKINEEIDALNTMGLSPVELLVLPKLTALLFVFPLLIFWADIFSLLGAMFMSKIMLGVGYPDFLDRIKETVGFKQFMLGLYKAPVFAIIIAMVGCFQGFAVGSSADNIGMQTTKSVVQALFLIIIADAAFSILYSWMGL